MKIKYKIRLITLTIVILVINPSFATIDLNKADDLGEIWGTYHGYDNYLDNDNDDWDDVYDDEFDKDDDLFDYFEVDDEDEDDLDDFESDFKSGFESDYDKAYDNIKKWSNDRDDEDLVNEADRIGKDFGQYDGTKDYFDNKSKDWEEAYEDRFDKDDDLFDYFDLDKDADEDEFESEFKSHYEEAYEDSYDDIEDDDDDDDDDKDNEEADDATIDKAKEDAEVAAEIDAKQAAYLDFQNREDNDWTDLYPSDNRIISKYNLDEDSNDYEENFLDEYEKQYQMIYEEEYRSANMERIKSKEVNAYEHGYQLGMAQGESAGYLDISQEKFSNWKNAYNLFLLNENLEMKYYLYRQNDEYKDSFENGFKTAFELGYEKTYNTTNIEIENNNLNYKKLSSDEIILEYDSYSLDFVSGGKTSNNKVPLYLEFEEGTVYSIGTYLGLNEEQFKVGGTYGKTLASKAYNVSIYNDSDKVRFEKPVKLAFNFSGSSKVGIYKHERGQWMYLPTEYGDGEVFTKIPEGDYSGGRYALLVDNNYRPSNDIKLHWSYPEIKLFDKRNIIYARSFVPKEGYRRKEFCDLILRNTLGSKEFKYNSVINFKDSDKFGKYSNAIAYMVNNGYISGVGEGKFAPDEYITYKEVEEVMGNILNRDFDWSEINEAMKRKRFKKSAVNQDKSNNINKAETLFMIHELLGSKVLFGSN